MNSKFKHTGSTRPAPDPEALAAFAAGAETRSTDIPSLKSVTTELRTSPAPSKKLTLVLDRKRWEALKQLCTTEDRSGQKILVEAFDLYLASKR